MTETRELERTAENKTMLFGGGKVRHGEVSIGDFVIPRASILHKDKEDVRAGTLVNSISNEPLVNVLIPLFPYKNYVKFNKDLTVEWSTLDRTDPKVVEGIENIDWEKGEKPTVTEFINFVCVFGFDLVTPLILSFKSTSLKLGRKYNTLFTMNCGIGATEKMRQQFTTKHRYNIETKQVNDKAFVYWHPVISIPKDKSLWVVSKEDQELLKGVADNFYGMIGKISDQTYQEERSDEGEEVAA